MSAPRQQRRFAPQLQLQGPRTNQPQLFTAELIGVTLNTVQFRLGMSAPNVLIYSQPQVYCVQLDAYPVSVTLSGNILECIYATILPTPATFILRPWDNGLRTRFGASLAPFILTSTGLADSRYAYTVVANGSDTVQFTADASIASCAEPSPDCFVSVVGGACLAVMRIDEVNFGLQFTNPMNAGDDVTAHDTGSDAWSNRGSRPQTETVIAT